MSQEKEHRHSELRMIPLNRIEVLNPRERNSRVFEQIVGILRHLTRNHPDVLNEFDSIVRMVALDK